MFPLLENREGGAARGGSNDSTLTTCHSEERNDEESVVQKSRFLASVGMTNGKKG